MEQHRINNKIHQQSLAVNTGGHGACAKRQARDVMASGQRGLGADRGRPVVMLEYVRGIQLVV